MIKRGFSLLVLLFCLPMVLGQCVTPEAGKTISEDTIFCAGEHILSEGMDVRADNIVIRCDGTEIKGQDEGAGITTVDRNNVTLMDCDISGFQSGIFIMNSESITIRSNDVYDNEHGVLLYGTSMSVIEQNVISGNTETGMIITESDLNSIKNNDFDENDIGMSMNISRSNDITGNKFSNNVQGFVLGYDNFFNFMYDNRFSMTGFNEEADENMDNSFSKDGTANEYLSGASGPGIREVGEDPELDETDSGDDIVIRQPEENPEMNVSEEDKGNVSERQETQETGTEEIDFEMTDSYITPEEIITDIFTLQGTPGDELEDAVDDAMQSMDELLDNGLEINKHMFVIYDERSTTVETNVRIKEDIETLDVYEYIPKCIVENVEEVEFQGQQPEVIEADPLIVWHYEDLKAGDEVNISYKVNKVFRRSPTTLAVSDKDTEIEIDECLCGTKENPVSLPIGECSKCTKGNNKYALIIPLVLVPIIVIAFVFFGRYKRTKVE